MKSFSFRFMKLKKHIYLIFLLLTLPLIGFSQNWESDWRMPIDPKPYNGLKGEVDSICEYVYKYDNEGFSHGKVEVLKMAFDEKGQMLSKITTSTSKGFEGHDLIVEEKNTYNENGLISQTDYLVNGVLSSKDVLKSAKPNERIYLYSNVGDGLSDNNGERLIFTQLAKNKVEILPSDSSAIISAVYNEKGERVIAVMRVLIKNDNTKVLKNERSEFEYDDRGFLIKETEMDSDEDEVITLFKYPEIDEQGNWIESLEYRENEKLPLKRTIRKIYYRK